MGAFWDWFIGEAGAAWIIGLLGLIGVIYTLFHRERAPRVILQETSSRWLLNIHDSQRDALRVQYGTPPEDVIDIHSLEQTDLVIYNTGTKDLTEPIEIMLRFRRIASSDGDTVVGFWRLTFDDAVCMAQPERSTATEPSDEVVVTVQYLNSYDIHGHCARGYLISENTIEPELVTGTGRGWSARCVTIRSFLEWNKRATKTVRNALTVATCALAVIAVVLLLQYPSLRAMIAPNAGGVATIADTVRLAVLYVLLISVVYLRGRASAIGELMTRNHFGTRSLKRLGHS